MARPRDDELPSEKQIGARIRVRAERADEAAQLFEANGFAPIYVEHRDDGDISFWFGKDTDRALYRLASSIPREFYALRGIAVGNNPPCVQQAGNDR